MTDLEHGHWSVTITDNTIRTYGYLAAELNVIARRVPGTRNGTITQHRRSWKADTIMSGTNQNTAAQTLLTAMARGELDELIELCTNNPEQPHTWNLAVVE